MIGGILKFLLALAILFFSSHSINFSDSYSSVPKPDPIYHFIIIGGGTAGCVVANRLSENPNWNVLVLEEGNDETDMHRIPAFVSQIPETQSFQKIPTVPQKTACFGMNDNVCIHAYGKVLGGSSSVNYMSYSRGNPCDFNLWAANGATGWSYPEVLPYFLKSERANLRGLENSPYHNRSGPLSVEDLPFSTKLADAAFTACQQAGYSHVDYNGPFQLGMSKAQTNTFKGYRHSANAAYLQPIRKYRSNLTIKTGARVTKILIDPKTKQAYGVEYFSNNQYHFVRAQNEVILSAGTVNSAKLLMLSGVGPRKHLLNLGIPVLMDLPVGQNYWDQIGFGGLIIKFKNIKGETFFPERFKESDLQKLMAGDPTTIFSSTGALETLAYLRIPNKTDDAYDQICCTSRPHFLIAFTPISLASDEGTILAKSINFKQEVYDKVFKIFEKTRQDHGMILISLLSPSSKGKVWLNSTDPFENCLIDPRYYEDPKDVEMVYQGLLIAKDILKQPIYQKLGAEIHDAKAPGCEHFDFDSREYWECAIRTICIPYHKVAGTCRMGSEKDPTTVVNHQLQVHGIGKLRVIDASVIPFPMAAHYTAPAIMIAEKASDMIKSNWQSYRHHYSNHQNAAEN